MHLAYSYKLIKKKKKNRESDFIFYEETNGIKWMIGRCSLK